MKAIVAINPKDKYRDVCAPVIKYKGIDRYIKIRIFDGIKTNLFFLRFWYKIPIEIIGNKSNVKCSGNLKKLLQYHVIFEINAAK